RGRPAGPERGGTAAGRLGRVIDLRLLREDPDRARGSQRARGEDPGLADALLAADERRRAAVSAADGLRAEQKALSKRIPRASAEERPTLLDQAKKLADEVKAAEADEATADAALRQAHPALPELTQGAPPRGAEDLGPP